MSSYIKPQSPLYNEAADTYIYPLTTVDQIVLSSGERLNESCFGKGIELNYSIIGGLEEPENPTENMIWVETDTIITNHIISKNEPKHPEEGMVWIYNNNTSNVNFYKLKYGDMGVDEVYPISAKQYVSGAWVDKSAKSYQDGEWVDWIVYLFNYGKQPFQWKATDRNGGDPWSGLAPTVTANADGSVTLSMNKPSASAKSGTYEIAAPVNLTGKSSITVKHSTSQSGPNDDNFNLILFGDSSGTSNIIARTVLSKSNTETTLPISGVGICYIAINVEFNGWDNKAPSSVSMTLKEVTVA